MLNTGRAAFLTMLFVVSSAQANLTEEMNDMFDSMVNLSAPTAHEGMRRGAITGGNVFIRNRIMTPNLVNLQVPSFSAGCGGIDLFGGSFSFINSAQFEQLLRSIAANAQGLLFQMALDAIDPGLASKLSDFQRKLQSMNQMLGNSCQLAKGLVTDVKSAVLGQQRKESGLIAQVAGGVTDAFEAMFPQDGSSPTQTAAAGAPAETAKRLEGNIVWEALQQNNAIGWFVNGDTELMEAIMSYTGSITVPPLAAGETEYKTNYLPGDMISLKDLVYGNPSITIYDCGADPKCLTPGDQTIVLKGMQERIEDLLLGPTGLLRKMETNTGGVSNDEKGFMNVSRGLGGMLHNLVVADRGMAALFVQQASPIIATELTETILNGMVQAVKISTFNVDKPWSKEVNEMIGEARRHIIDERNTLAQTHGSVSDMYDVYQDLITSAKTHRYSIQSISGM